MKGTAKISPIPHEELGHVAERRLADIQSPRKPNGLSHCIFECLIVEASSQAQNHLSVLADRYTERCRGVFDCTCPVGKPVRSRRGACVTVRSTRFGPRF